MAAQSIASLIAIMRDRTGDNNSSSLFLTDPQWTRILETAERRLKKYIRIEDEIPVAGTGSQEYTIPAGAVNVQYSEVFIRSGADHSSDRRAANYKTNAGKIYLPITISSSEKIVFWVKRPFILGTDELTEDALELLQKIAEIEYCTYAISRRQDFVAWASINRNDASVNQLVISKQELKRDLEDWATEMGEGTDIIDCGGY